MRVARRHPARACHCRGNFAVEPAAFGAVRPGDRNRSNALAGGRPTGRPPSAEPLLAGCRAVAFELQQNADPVIETFLSVRELPIVQRRSQLALGRLQRYLRVGSFRAETFELPEGFEHRWLQRLARFE